MPYCSKLHRPHTNYHLLAAQQEPHKKDSLLTKNAGEFSGTKSREWTISGTNDKPERDRDRKSESRTRQKNERGDRKKVLNDSPGIPDRR